MLLSHIGQKARHENKISGVRDTVHQGLLQRIYEENNILEAGLYHYNGEYHIDSNVW